VAETAGITLTEGRGDDPDTLGRREVFIMDTERFPFQQAEIYHQFHGNLLITTIRLLYCFNFNNN
jgi:hypothetical protein